ncbi:MAG TPA: GNAT family N-acetyltransferase [Solirubrobacteraceae bacterium]|nr:GNAT family N-acetyltransferase [Solirubrobacteraceae bacterium]
MPSLPGYRTSACASVRECPPTTRGGFARTSAPTRKAVLGPATITAVDDLRIRLAQANDSEFLAQMLDEAFYWRPDGSRPPMDTFLREPHLARYTEGCGRAGDFGVIGEDVETRALIGACWARTFTDADHGYGYVDATTPEITLAVVRASRSQGVGRRLIAALMDQARGQGVTRLSLSVEDENRGARHLYESVGFVTVGRVDNADTMLIRLDAAEPALVG